jgi:hypothetical protein
MAKYGYVSNGIVAEAYDALPENWRNISNFYLYQDDTQSLMALGWYPVVDITQPHDPLMEIYGPVEYTFDVKKQIIFQQAPVIPSPNPMTQQEVFLHERQSFLQQLTEIKQTKLQQCDWTRLDDVQSEHDAQWNNNWLEYRRQLRGIDTVYSNPPYDTVTDINQVSWPIIPNS